MCIMLLVLRTPFSMALEEDLPCRMALEVYPYHVEEDTPCRMALEEYPYHVEEDTLCRMAFEDDLALW